MLRLRKRRGVIEMKKIKIFKSIPVITVGLILLVSAAIFPVFAEKIQVKGMENGAKNLEVGLSKMPDLIVKRNQDETKLEDIITMTEEEEKIFDDIVLMIQKSTSLTVPQNRERSKSESDRIIDLRKKFSTGSIKSQKTLPIGKELEKPYFNPENETYYYPEAEMRDEQLLQIIDFEAKLDKAFEKSYEAYIQNVMENTDIKITEEEAIESAKSAVQRIYNVELDNMEVNSTFSVDEYHNESSWRVIFQPKNMEILKKQEKLYWMYFVKVDIHSGRVDYVDSYYSNQIDETKESVKVDLNNIGEHKDIAENILKDRLNAKNIEFQKAYTRKPGTLFKEDIISKHLYLIYKAEGKYIEFDFLYGSRRMVALFYYDDPVILNEKINEREQESVGYIITNKITVLEDNGRRIPANSKHLQLKDGSKIIALEGDIKCDPENTLFAQQKKISDEIFKDTGMRMDFRIGAIKYEAKDKVDLTKTKLDTVNKYPFEGYMQELKTKQILPYKLEKGIFVAQSEKDFEVEFYLEDGEYGGKIESEFNHDTGLYELDTKISGIEYYLVVLKNMSEDISINIKYNIFN